MKKVYISLKNGKRIEYNAEYRYGVVDAVNRAGEFVELGPYTVKKDEIVYISFKEDNDNGNDNA